MSKKNKAKDESKTKREVEEQTEATSASAEQSEDQAEAKPEQTEAGDDSASEDATPAGASAESEAAADSEAATDLGGDGDGAAAEVSAEDGELYGLLAEFDSPGALIAAAEKVRDAGYSQWDCYSPFPVHGLDPAMGIKRTVLPWIVFVIGLCGLGGGLLLQWWTNAWDWRWIVSGKPFFSLPANIPITFETTILASVFASFFGMWALNKLPQHWHPFFRKDRFLRATDDRFFIGIEAGDRVFQRGKTQALLEEAGALAVETCYVSNDPRRWAMPRPIVGFIIVSCVAALVPFALIAKARATKSPDPRVHVFSDMDFQPKAKAQNASVLFADGRASRMPVRGTVARGQLELDDHFYRGMEDGQWARSFPPGLDISASTVERGQERYGIYCQPCHGASGDGNGMVHQRAMTLGRHVRGWVQPTSLHQEGVIRQPHGQLFNTISNGIRTMPAYGAQIPEEDRWAIVLYLRALQRSQNANLDDVPADKRQQIR